MRAVLIIVIENCRNQTINGYLQSLYQEKSFCFHGLDHMLLLMEYILDREGMPADSGEFRHLAKMDPVKKRTKIISDAETVPRKVKFCPIRNRLNTRENVLLSRYIPDRTPAYRALSETAGGVPASEAVWRCSA